MIKQFLSFLSQTDLNLDYRQIEEVLWLSRFMPKVTLLKGGQIQSEPTVLPVSGQPSIPKLPLQSEVKKTVSPTISNPSEPSSQAEVKKPIFPSGSKPSSEPLPQAEVKKPKSPAISKTSSGLVAASKFRIAGAPPLPEAPAISRALRPFSRHFKSHQSFVLDEEVTVSQLAEVGFTFPAFRPAKERWFEVFLVVEDSPSMVVWHSTIRMLAQLLARHGAFRDVRVWKLRSHESKVQIIDSSEFSYQPGILRDPAGRRLLIVLTDGVSAAWQNGRLANTLIDWGSVTPVVICQMLGESLWKSTILGEPNVVVRTSMPGVPNKRLEVERPWWAETFPVQESDSTQPAQKPVQLAIPIVSLKPELIEDWAKMLMGQGIPYSATLVSASSDVSKFQPRIEPLERMGPEEHLERFRALVSPETYGLACYLSWMPLTLSVIQLVHYRMIATRNQEQLAELLLGGILKRQIPSEPKGEVEYEFVEGVREKLQQESTDALEQVFACVSEYVEHQIGKPFDFLACLRHPQGRESLPAIARPFARVSIPGLRQLGLTHLTLNDLEELSSLPPTFTNSIGMEFVLIPSGSFLMGSPDTEVGRYSDEGPLHTVTFSKPFHMGKFQVTQAQWWAVMGNNPSYFNGKNSPVENVSWDDCQEFLKKLNAKKDGYTYRLPSEAEWEYACRAGSTTPFSFGETITTNQVNYNGKYPYGNAPKGKYRQKTTPAGSFPPNAWGLHDMHGNVWEWCQDSWHSNYDGVPTDGSAWDSEFDNEFRTVRGGSWNYHARNCRSAIRLRDNPVNLFRNVGFRVVAVRAVNI